MKNLIEETITDFVVSYQEKNKTETAWGIPIIGFANSRDNLFKEIKNSIDKKFDITGEQSYKLPEDLLEDAETVICYFVPFDKKIAESNKNFEITASREWALAYSETNSLLVALADHLIEELEKLKYKGSGLPPTHQFDKEKLISKWSHRHAAYIAGIGTFGLNNMLITEKGCAGRFSSLVTNLKIVPTERSEKENCLYKHSKACKKCLKNCPSGALTIEGFDRHKCYEVCLYNMKTYESIGNTDVCGKCLSVMPCSFTSPTVTLYR